MLKSSCWHLLASSLVLLLLLTPWLPAEPVAPDEVSRPVRVADLRPVERVFPGTSHSHPGICVTRSGAIVVVHYVENAGLVLITRGETGQQWCERIWTVMATCAQQSRNVFNYLCAAVADYFQGEATPSLLAEG